ncbi:hypothetical protein [Hymenobacter rigui]|uniref:Uncharacterized protein n=1 Tax=Hymenobacter rigui TaxID=334424 RepID=A0A3R9MMK2_9BACT|nr:hypothetical protein [Hymenobacter rigui]RSK43931.1 hypothetical protein EI291_20880 [Hymenobacter rigui]
MEPTPAPKHYIGRILLINLALVLVLHIGRQLLTGGYEGIFMLLFVLAYLNVMGCIGCLVSGRGKTSIGFLLAALLVFVIGFGDCATHLRLGGMH